MNKPVNLRLYEKVKDEAKRKFDVYPSIYANSWVVREYKKRGGKYSGKRNTNQGLLRWYREEWIDVCRLPELVPCGRPITELSISKWKKTYPYCRPRYKVSEKTPKTVRKLSPKEIKKRCKKKKSSPYDRILESKKKKSPSKKKKSPSKKKKSPSKKKKSPSKKKKSPSKKKKI